MTKDKNREKKVTCSSFNLTKLQVRFSGRSVCKINNTVLYYQYKFKFDVELSVGLYSTFSILIKTLQHLILFLLEYVTYLTMSKACSYLWSALKLGLYFFVIPIVSFFIVHESEEIRLKTCRATQNLRFPGQDRSWIGTCFQGYLRVRSGRR